jgi:tRNA(fMet)-specific endonuclease VapC
MRFLLDTDTLSFVMRRDHLVLAKFTTIKPAMICLSVVTVIEKKPSVKKKLQPVLEQILEGVSILDYTYFDALHTARVRAALEAKGKKTGSYDLLLAGTAIARGLIVVTNNIENFQHVPGLVFENWQQP